MFESIPAVRPLAAPRPARLRDWVREHDERWTFVVLYLGLAVGLSVFVSLFWLLVVAGLHFALELWRQSHFRDGRREVVGHALWEVKLDVGLVLLALTLVLYIDVVLGLLGLQSAARAAAATRAGARIGSRAAAWERNIRTFLLTVDEMARVTYAAWILGRRGGAGHAGKPAADRPAMVVREAAPTAAPVTAHVAGPGDGWRGRWGLGDRIGVVLVVAGMLLLLAAPFMTVHDWGSAITAILAELRPFPS
jgi:hypothetical protein